MAETMGFDPEGTRRAHDEVYAQNLENMMGNIQFSNDEDHAIAAAIDALRRPSGYRYPVPAEDKALLEAAELEMGVRSDGWVKVMSMLCARIRDYAELNARSVRFPALGTDPAADDAIDKVMKEYFSVRPLVPAPPKSREIHVVFDGPPGPECGRFVECETADGQSVHAGEWRQSGDYWHLILNVVDEGA